MRVDCRLSIVECEWNGLIWLFEAEFDKNTYGEHAAEKVAAQLVVQHLVNGFRMFALVRVEHGAQLRVRLGRHQSDERAFLGAPTSSSRHMQRVRVRCRLRCVYRLRLFTRTLVVQEPKQIFPIIIIGIFAYLFIHSSSYLFHTYLFHKEFAYNSIHI